MGGRLVKMTELLPAPPTNYTGPYISDGKWQPSVAFGEKLPVNELDALSRLHDSAYARWEDVGHRRAADALYFESAKTLGVSGKVAGELVTKGNQVLRAGENLLESVVSGSKFGPLGTLVGLVYGAVTNMVSLNDTLVNGDRYRKEVLAYYATDPLQGTHSAEAMRSSASKQFRAGGPQEESVSMFGVSVPQQVYQPPISMDWRTVGGGPAVGDGCVGCVAPDEWGLLPEPSASARVGGDGGSKLEQWQRRKHRRKRRQAHSARR